MLVTEALQAGATGFILKNSDYKTLRSAITQIANNQIYISPPFQDEMNRSTPGKILTTREKDILSSLANGLTMKEIGDLFNLSPKTIETYRTRLSKKTGLSSIPELTQLAVRLGLC